MSTPEKLPFQVHPPTALTGLVGEIQDCLEDVYGIKKFGLLKATDFLWPEKRPLHAKLSILADPSRARTMYRAWTPNEDNTTIKRWISRFFPPQMYADFLPVIYLPSDVVAKINSPTLEELAFDKMDPETIEAIDTVIEEVGHFVYDQLYWELYCTRPSLIDTEAMALINLYQVYKIKCGVDFSRPLHHVTSRILVHLNYFRLHRSRPVKEMTVRRGVIRVTNEDAEPHYRQSMDLINGYYEHLLRLDETGQNHQDDLITFYQMRGIDKLNYLKDLYQQLILQGRPNYLQHMEGLVKLEKLPGLR